MQRNPSPIKPFQNAGKKPAWTPVRVPKEDIPRLKYHSEESPLLKSPYSVLFPVFIHIYCSLCSLNGRRLKNQLQGEKKIQLEETNVWGNGSRFLCHNPPSLSSALVHTFPGLLLGVISYWMLISLPAIRLKE